MLVSLQSLFREREVRLPAAKQRQRAWDQLRSLPEFPFSHARPVRRSKSRGLDMIKSPSSLTRRSIFRAGAGLAVATTATPLFVPALAWAENARQAGAAPLNGNGFYRFRIGDFQATVISDGYGPIPVSILVSRLNRSFATQSGSKRKWAGRQSPLPRLKMTISGRGDQRLALAATERLCAQRPAVCGPAFRSNWTVDV
jgi:hypothetical protein